MRQSHKRSPKKRAATRSSPSKFQVLPAHPNHYFADLRHTAFVAIAEARKRCNPGPRSLFTEEDCREAKSFLRNIANEARNEGKRRGDSPSAEENRFMLNVLDRLAGGADLKSCVAEGLSDTFENRHRSLSTRVNRFCKRVFQAVVAIRRTEELSKNREGTIAVQLLTPGFFRYALKERNSSGVNFSTDCRALRHAVRLGEALHRK
jgi:hypothetical protein